MDFGAIWIFIVGLLPQIQEIGEYVLMGLGSLVVLASAYVKVTPSQEDDAWFAKLEAIPVLGNFIQFVLRFSAIQRK